jgi:hypothetical protein
MANTSTVVQQWRQCDRTLCVYLFRNLFPFPIAKLEMTSSTSTDLSTYNCYRGEQ